MIESLFIADIEHVLSEARFRANTELALQDGVQQVLDRNFPGAFIREYGGFGRRDRPDFYCPARGTVVEVKINTSGGSAPKVFSQLMRYAEHKAVKDIVLVTPSRRIASLVGDRVLSKPLTRVVVSMGI